MLEVEHVYKSFGKNDVLKDVSLKVNKGDVVAILGPSGTGKTTLLRSINFLNGADSGTITIDGYKVDCKHHNRKSVLQIRRKTAMVFQQYNLFNNKTVIENVIEGLVTAKKIPKKEALERGMKELEKVGLMDKVNAYPCTLSGGQQQRVGIARALALDPDVILFDEPTSALDPEKVGEVLETIKKVALEGITMIIVTHEIMFARSVANRVIFMDGGEIVEDGPTDEVFLRPKQDRTKQFLKVINDGFAYTI